MYRVMLIANNEALTLPYNPTRMSYKFGTPNYTVERFPIKGSFIINSENSEVETLTYEGIFPISEKEKVYRFGQKLQNSNVNYLVTHDGKIFSGIVSEFSLNEESPTKVSYSLTFLKSNEVVEIPTIISSENYEPFTVNPNLGYFPVSGTTISISSPYGFLFSTFKASISANVQSVTAITEFGNTITPTTSYFQNVLTISLPFPVKTIILTFSSSQTLYQVQANLVTTTMKIHRDINTNEFMVYGNSPSTISGFTSSVSPVKTSIGVSYSSSFTLTSQFYVEPNTKYFLFIDRTPVVPLTITVGSQQYTMSGTYLEFTPTEASTIVISSTQNVILTRVKLSTSNNINNICAFRPFCFAKFKPRTTDKLASIQAFNYSFSSTRQTLIYVSNAKPMIIYSTTSNSATNLAPFGFSRNLPTSPTSIFTTNSGGPIRLQNYYYLGNYEVFAIYNTITQQTLNLILNGNQMSLVTKAIGSSTQQYCEKVGEINLTSDTLSISASGSTAGNVSLSGILLLKKNDYIIVSGTSISNIDIYSNRIYIDNQVYPLANYVNVNDDIYVMVFPVDLFDNSVNSMTFSLTQ